eukprot:CAMPEP_0176212560 /NCGR_PEP_ID=MMETSP0121_2-20121125/15215_1 /TAXON_ID=160619 /ORGANISM="Kryptoperidinium foliaceum, Strain CCMP 1326" /LENGTH=82 /DNA_ID=CAMNT_0017551613 /DNA_START=14 /DNA_END=258 /DNA_ORIENTATION=+
MSSMAFFTRVNASNFTWYANVAKRGLCIFDAAADSTCAASWRRLDCTAPSRWSNAGLKVRVKRSCASSPLKTAKALETASIS